AQPVTIQRDGTVLRVLLGRFGSRAEAEEALRSLAARGLGSGWVTQRVR
ncbi:MAG: SPOR domain-containing protein, partial [Gemmatimonadetes bacterium]|nr:SPOR domain-containing protein [Gemmatimonadota bacterium]